MKGADLPEMIESLKIQLGYSRSCGIKYFQPSDKGQVSGGINKQQSLDKIVEEMGACTRCKLHRTRKNIVFGEGNPDAKLMFVGEAPGADEDVQGQPFVGRAGQLLTRIIEAIDLKRSEVYIGNIIKCRPPSNRNPEEDEVCACIPFLRKQIEVIDPDIICTLGNIATQSLLETSMGITKLRGKFHDLDGRKVMPTYHPSYLLRNQAKKRETWEDMKMVRAEYLSKS